MSDGAGLDAIMLLLGFISGGSALVGALLVIVINALRHRHEHWTHD